MRGLTFALSLAFAAPLSAASGGAPALNAHSHAPSALGGDGVLLPSIAGPPQLGAEMPAYDLSFHTDLGYSRRGLSFSSRADGTRRVQVVHGDVAMLNVGGGAWVGPWGFDAMLPIALLIRGGGPNLVGVDPALAPTTGDLRLGLRRRLFSLSSADLGRIDAGARAHWSAPTAGTSSWLGSGGGRFDIGLLVAWRRGALFADLELGAVLRPVAALDIDEVDPATGEVRRDAAGQPLRQTVLASGTRLVSRVRVGGLLPWGGLQVAAEAQGQWDLAAAATAGQWLGDGLLSAEIPLQREAFRLFAALGGAATSSWGSAQVRALAGLRVRPGAMPADSDGDGLDDRDDACPKVAEDRDGFEDANGCPDPDDDGDGVLDRDDRCRLEAEDRDGFQDADGCPDADDDADGVLDSADACPRPAAGASAAETAEDRDGHADHDGCPDPDNDGDGVLDADDLCPDARESVNGHDDGDGCPDQLPPPAVQEVEGRLLLARPIRFEVGGAALHVEGRAVVALVAATLRALKDVRGLEIVVHGDDSGTPAQRLAETQARAEAIKAVLVGSSGLEAHQIVARGAADKEPIASNSDAFGRARNRRVELRLIRESAAPAAAAAGSTSSAPDAKSKPPSAATESGRLPGRAPRRR